MINQITLDENLSQDDLEDELGCLIAQWAGYDGWTILRVLFWALEDANRRMARKLQHAGYYIVIACIDFSAKN